MAKMMFVNLPVADVARSTAFYEALGFVKEPRFSNDHASAFHWGDGAMVMVLDRAFVATLTPRPIIDAHSGIQALFALGMDSRDEVDAIVEKAAAAGGTIDASPPEDLGFMYSRDFTDPDGHAFGPFFMDEAKAAEMSGETAAA